MSKNLDFKSDRFRPYAQALGEVALAWNDLHIVLSGLFGTALGIPNRLVADALWNSLKADRAQREILGDLVGLQVIGYNIPKQLQAEIKWVLSQAEKLEDFRNDALHSPLLNNDDQVFAWYHLGNKRAKKLAGKDILRECSWFYETAVILRSYAETLGTALRNPRQPLPDRPSLPNRGDSKKSSPPVQG